MPVAPEEESIALARISDAILGRVKQERETPEAFFGRIIRTGLDEVIDGPRTGRWELRQLSSTEQTYVGTKIEIITRSALEAEHGQRSDIRIAGYEVDIKWSKTGVWMIGPENVGEVCLGLGTNSDQELFSAGLFIPYEQRLGAPNRDKKKCLTAASRANCIRWLVQEARLPTNFIAELPDTIRREVFAQQSAEARVRTLVLLMPRVFIPRTAFETVALGKQDPMRRLRVDRGKGETLGGMRLLSTKFGKEALLRLGFREFPPDHWIAISIDELRAHGLE